MDHGNHGMSMEQTGNNYTTNQSFVRANHMLLPHILKQEPPPQTSTPSPPVAPPPPEIISTNSSSGKKRESTTLHDKISIMDWHFANGKNQLKTVQFFKENGFAGLSQPTLSRWLKAELELRNQLHSGTDPFAKRLKVARMPQYEGSMIVDEEEEEEECEGPNNSQYDEGDVEPYDRGSSSPIQGEQQQQQVGRNPKVEQEEQQAAAHFDEILPLPLTLWGDQAQVVDVFGSGGVVGGVGGSLKRRESTLQDKVTIMDWHYANGENQLKTVRHFKRFGFPCLKQPTLSKWLKVEDELRIKLNSGTDPSAKRFRMTKNPHFEEAMSLWVDQMEASQFKSLTGKTIKEVATKFYDMLQVPLEARLKLSNGWLERFKSRQILKFARFHRDDTTSFPIGNVDHERTRIAALLTAALSSGFSLDDIYNMDETSFFYDATPERRGGDPNTPDRRLARTRLTLALTVNATGTDRLEPLFIGTANKPKCFRKMTAQQLGFQYFHNKRAWMTGDIFRAWLLEWNARLCAQERKVILLVDDFSGHKINQDDVPNIHLEFFATTLTCQVQPCDAGIVRTFKATYRRHFVMRGLDALIGGAQSPEAFFKIDQLQAMKLARRSWEEMSPSTIFNCWLATRILPKSACPEGSKLDSSHPPESEAVVLLHSAMEQLRAEADTHGVMLDFMDAKDFVAQGETDEFAHVRPLNVEDIAEFVRSHDQSSSAASATSAPPPAAANDYPRADSGDEAGPEPVTDKEAFVAILCLQRYFTERSQPADQDLMCLLEWQRMHLHERLSAAMNKRFSEPPSP